ncbi:OmpW/AlkL family protein [Cycloclasticus pugetii]|uniref:OmpW/AlkL family protein n=1 Tax=Cycloclasticus pugetii TaxID=34068 RepID=UPI0003631015|nr:OmpW family outer membrane protein [Cycloclasticus pugetii]
MKLIKNTTVLCAALGLTVVATPSLSYETGDLIVRGRIISVDPQDDSSSVSINGASVAGSGAFVDSDIMPELDFTYMLDPHWGLELILAYTEHKVDAGGSLGGLNQIGDTKVLPPTLTLQYHFAPTSNIRPYVGAGINYTHFFDSTVKGALDAPGADLEIDDSWGLAAQAGVDIDLNDTWFVNFDVKYIDIEADAHIKNGANIKVDIDIDPIVWGIGIGRTF